MFLKPINSILMNVENKNSDNKELFRRTEINNSPFVVISRDDTNEHFVAMGTARLSPIFETQGEAMTYLQTDNWESIISVILACINTFVKDDSLIK